MIKISVNEEKTIDFKFELSGLSPNQIDMKLRTIIDGVEYGFPAQMKQESIHVTIPPLKTVVKRDFREGETFPASLDVIGDGHFLQPWSDDFKIHNPIKMEAEVRDGDYIEEETKPEITVRVSEGQQTGDNAKLKNMVKRRVKKALKESGTRGRSSSVSRVRESKVKQTPKMTKDQFMQMTQEDIMSYIKRRATKDPRIQEIIYNQAVSAAKTSTPYKVFPYVMEILGRKKK